MSQFAAQHTNGRSILSNRTPDHAGLDLPLHRALRQRGIALRCRTAELAGALRRFRERQAEINSGCPEAIIRMPPVAAASWVDRTQ